MGWGALTGLRVHQDGGRYVRQEEDASHRPEHRTDRHYAVGYMRAERGCGVSVWDERFGPVRFGEMAHRNEARSE